MGGIFLEKKIIFVKIFNDFVKISSRLSRSEILTFLWLSIHADSRGNIVWLTPELRQRLLTFVGIKSTSMYNVFTKLEKRGFLNKEGQMVILNAKYANKHRQNKVEVTPYNWSLTELDY